MRGTDRKRELPPLSKEDQRLFEQVADLLFSIWDKIQREEEEQLLLEEEKQLLAPQQGKPQD